MWKLILFVIGRILRSLATVLLVVPILILLFDVLIITLPVILFGLSISSEVIQGWFANSFSLLGVTYQIIALLGVIGITLEFLFPNIKRRITNLLSDENKIFYVFLAAMTGACVVLFLYTLPLFIESGWPYGSKEGLIAVVGFMGISHLFGSRWLSIYVSLDKVATKLINYKSSNIVPEG